MSAERRLARVLGRHLEGGGGRDCRGIVSANDGSDTANESARERPRRGPRAARSAARARTPRAGPREDPAKPR